LEEVVSPIKAFINECCDLGPFKKILRLKLYQAYLGWCRKTGQLYPVPFNIFGKMLRAAYHRV
jgi:phage/plasmid-associated DNA primase